MTTDPLTLELNNFFGIEFVVPVGRGSLGIYAALRAWGGSNNHNCKVAVPAAVCQDVIAAILMAGRQPFFCDVDPATGLVPAGEWLRAKAGGCEAAIVVHLYGNPTDTAAARTAFPDGLVIDDAAQALGARTAYGLAGTGGDIGLISFGHTKHIEVGGAVLLCRDASLARSCAEVLKTVPVAKKAEADSAERIFRLKFEVAREQMRLRGNRDGFKGLLNGYDPALQLAWNPAWSEPIISALRNYPSRLADRRAKSLLWRQVTAGTGLVPVGMDDASAPWRYACRMPGIDWMQQHCLGQNLRSHGLHVSHWYLPAHWLHGTDADSLPGSEQLAQEIFQFWLDGATGADAIEHARNILQEIFVQRKFAV